MATVDTITHGLTEEEREKYAKDGFFIRSDAFDTYEIYALRDRIEDLVELIETSDVLTEKEKQGILKRNVGADATSGPASLNSITRLHRFSALVRSHIRDPRRLDAVAEIVGSRSVLPKRSVFFQTPGHWAAHCVASGFVVFPQYVYQQRGRRHRPIDDWNLAGTG